MRHAFPSVPPAVGDAVAGGAGGGAGARGGAGGHPLPGVLAPLARPHDGADAAGQVRLPAGALHAAGGGRDGAGRGTLAPPGL